MILIAWGILNGNFPVQVFQTTGICTYFTIICCNLAEFFGPFYPKGTINFMCNCPSTKVKGYYLDVVLAKSTLKNEPPLIRD